MPTIDNLDIQISTRLKSSNKQIDALIKKLNTVSSSISKVGTSTNNVSSATSKISASTTKSTKSFKGLASAFGKFYASYFLVIRGIKGLYKSIESTADYLEAFNYFEVSFNKIAKDWKKDYSKYGYENAEEYAESFNKRAKEGLSKLSGVQIQTDKDGNGILTQTGTKNLGLNIQEITQFASQLASVTNSVGQSGEVSLAASNSFTKLAGDISSLFNQDYSAVAKNLQSGLIGQSRALYKYGIDITNATLQTYAYNMGIKKNVSEMTQAEKMQLRMIAILDQSKVSWGDLANTIDSPSNMLRQFKNNLKEAGLVLGQLFIPLLGKVLPILNGVTIAIKNLMTNIAGFLGIKLDLDEFGQSGADDMEDLSEGLDDVSESAKKAKKNLRGFDELKTISSGSDSSGLSNTIDLTNEIIKATEEYESVWTQAYEQMENKAQNFADKVTKYLKPIENLFKDIGKGNWFEAGEDVSNIISGLFDMFSRAIKGVNWEKFGKNAGEFISGLDWFEIIGSAIKLAWTTAGGITDFLITFTDGFNEEKFVEKFAENLKNADWKKVLKEIGAGLFKVDDLIEALRLKQVFRQFASDIEAFKLAIEFWEFVFTFDIEKLKKRVQEKWNNFSNWWKSRPKLKEIDFQFSDLLGIIKKLWNDIINWWKNKPRLGLELKVAYEDPKGIAQQAIVSALNLKGWPQFKFYEAGGFPKSADLFWANENGVPELVGTMGGKTAVASGGEITGIKDAIYSTGERESGLMRTMVGLLQIIAEKEYGITDSDIGKSAQRYAKDYFNRTGEEAYSF